MSGFRDTFGRNNEENILGYDDSASLFFIGSVLLCAAVPWTVIFFRRILRNSEYQRKKINHCTCSLCKSSETDKNKQNLYKKVPVSVLKISDIAQIVILFTFWCLIVFLIVQLKHTSQLTVFDPFEILEISTSASTKEIKKAYHTLSLRFHPDKNPNDPSSAARFIMISKAYGALTDETAKANYKKYGNPDGPGVMKIGIGLPKFLLKEKYQLGILLALFTIFLILIPSCFLTYYHKQKRFGSNGLLLETMGKFNALFKENTRTRNFVEIFVNASECQQNTQLRSSDNNDMQNVIYLIEEYGKKPSDATPLTLRNYYLVLAHIQRLHDALTLTLKEELYILLRLSDKIVNGMIEICVAHRWRHAAAAAVEFSQCLVQALGPSDNSLLQIPHFTQERIKHCLKGKNATRDLKSFKRQEMKDRKGLLDLTIEQLADVEAFLSTVPDIKLKTELMVIGEEYIIEGDLITLYVMLTRQNLSKNETSGLVHAPFFPKQLSEAWWIFVHDKQTNNLVACALSTDKSQVIEKSVQFWAEGGRRTYVVTAMCTVFAGLDLEAEISINVLRPDKNATREVYIHPDDAKLDTDPTLMATLLGTVQQTLDSDEESDISFDKEKFPDTLN